MRTDETPKTKGRPRFDLPHDLHTYHGRVGAKMLPQADFWSRVAVRIGAHARLRVNADIEISMAAEGISFAGEAAVLDSDAVLTLGI